jgi:hypothetical protein
MCKTVEKKKCQMFCVRYFNNLETGWLELILRNFKTPNSNLVGLFTKLLDNIPAGWFKYDSLKSRYFVDCSCLHPQGKWVRRKTDWAH